MTVPLAYLHGRFLPYEEARLPLHDAGFVFGATITDLCRTFRHRLYRWNDHLARFRRSCQLARVPLLQSDADLTNIANELVARNAALLQPEQDLALVLFATPGALPHYAGLPVNLNSAPTFGMHTFPLPFARFRHLFERGAHLVIPQVRQVPGTGVDPMIKQRSRLHWWIAEQQAHDMDPLSSALLLDREGHLTETAAANLLLVRQGVVYSPRSGSILPGVSLQTVRELCGMLGIGFAERDLTIVDIQGADEAMLTNTSYCLAGVSRIQDTELPWPGPITERLLRSWSDQVGFDVVEQILRAP